MRLPWRSRRISQEPRWRIPRYTAYLAAVGFGRADAADLGGDDADLVQRDAGEVDLGVLIDGAGYSLRDLDLGGLRPANVEIELVGLDFGAITDADHFEAFGVTV